MADNSTVPIAVGTEVFANKDIGGVKFPKHIQYDSSGAEVVAPVGTQIGSVTETAPGTDTASSGLNGRLQRVAQRLTSLAALLPAALGAGGGLKIDGSGTAIPVSGTFFQATQPVSIASVPSHPVTNAGTFAVQATQTISASANGQTSSRVNAAATTNATNLKASAGQIGEIDLFNVAAYNVFLKFYNKASSPTVGTDTPIWTVPIPAGGGYSRSFPRGKTFSTGISYAITKNQADSDTTVLAAGDLTGSIDWI